MLRPAAQSSRLSEHAQHFLFHKHPLFRAQVQSERCCEALHVSAGLHAGLLTTPADATVSACSGQDRKPLSCEETGGKTRVEVHSCLRLHRLRPVLASCDTAQVFVVFADTLCPAFCQRFLAVNQRGCVAQYRCH